jgi:energy-coupling factor transporter ATP-binding protein EcfA2
MFDDFYGLTGKPFQLTPDPAFYFRSRDAPEGAVVPRLRLAQGEGFIVITGEVGAGKSTLVAHLMGTIDPQQLTVGADRHQQARRGRDRPRRRAELRARASRARQGERARRDRGLSSTARRAPGGAAC